MTKGKTKLLEINTISEPINDIKDATGDTVTTK